jgi:hypothetical protein
MGTKKSNAQTPLEKSLDEAVAELETLGDEIRLNLHLAGMEANTLWSKTLEPRLFEARVHASEARAASLAAVQDTIKALRDFSAALFS